MKSVIVEILLLLSFFCSCRSQNEQVKKSLPQEDSTADLNLTNNQKKVLAGAKKCLETGFKYDRGMAYYVLKYHDTGYVGSKVYPMGDLEPALGVCTEVTIRALRWGNVCDLQEEIHNDIKAHRDDYPVSRWNAKKPDANIDHRRVPNQLVWFKKNWQEMSNGKYGPGDVVIWDMDSDSWTDHIGIISDKFVNGVPCVIHNFPSPGYVAEEDVLNRWKIVGVFRVKD